MSKVLKQFDLTDIASEPLMRDLVNELNSKAQACREACRAVIPEEHMPLVYAALNANEDRQLVSGARIAMLAFTKAERVAAKIAYEREESAHYRHAKARIQELEEEVRRLRQERQATQTPAPALPVEPPAPADWDYPEQKRRRVKRDEVVTESPFAVEVIARQIEETVKQFGGRCRKPDISARMPPEARAHLSAAYRHLHASRRVRVDGWDLSTWK